MSNQAPEMKKFDWKKLLRALGHTLMNNWPMKLVALLLSLLLWAGLITQDPTLMREKSFSNVNVSITGTDTIKRNGFIVVSDLSEMLGDVDMQVSVPQMQYQNVTAANYNVRLDLSRIKQAGTQTLKISTNSTNSYGSVVELNPSSVEIEVEPYVTRYRIPVRLTTVGTVPDGIYSGLATMDPPLVAVSGPKSLVDQIVCAEVVVEQGNLPQREGRIRQALPFTLLDANNNAIKSDLLEVTSESVLVDSVIVEQRMYSTKEIELCDLGLVRGTPAAGYEIKSVSVTPQIITVAGEASELDDLNLLYADSYVDVTGLSETVNGPVRIRYPSELTYMSATSCTVVVEIGPIITSRSFSDIRLGVENVERGFTASLGTKMGGVSINGPQLWVNSLGRNNVELYVDASGLQAGVYELPVLCRISGNLPDNFSIEALPQTIEVTISAK